MGWGYYLAWFVIIGLSIFLIWAKRIQIQDKKAHKDNLIKRAEEEGLMRRFLAWHVDGLVLPPNYGLYVEVFTNRIEFVSPCIHQVLPIQSIRDVGFFTSDEIRAGSVGGAVLGSVTMGTAGAVIGASPKKERQDFLYITYMSKDSGEMKNIVLNITFNPKIKDRDHLYTILIIGTMNKLVAFMPQQSTTIEL